MISDLVQKQFFFPNVWWCCIILVPYLSSLKVVTYLKTSSYNEKTRRVQNLGQNVCGRFHVLVQFLFTTSETELDFINRKWMCEVPHELPNNLRLKNLGNLITSTQPTTQKPNFDVYGKISQKISCKTFHRKIYFAYFRQFFPQLFVQDCNLWRNDLTNFTKNELFTYRNTGRHIVWRKLVNL